MEGLRGLLAIAGAVTLAAPTSPPMLLQPAAVFVNSDAIDAGVRSFLPLKLAPKVAGAESWVVADAVACGSDGARSQKVLLFASTDGVAAPRLKRTDCSRALTDLASGACGELPELLAIGRLDWADPRVSLHVTESIRRDKTAAGSCQVSSIDPTNWEAYLLNKSVVLAALSVTQPIDVDFLGQGDGGTVFITPKGMPPISLAEMRAQHELLKSAKGSALENAVFDLSVEDLSRNLETSIRANPITFDITNSGNPLPRKGTISSANVQKGPGASLLVKGDLVTDNSGSYETTITLSGSDLAIQKVDAVYRLEACNEITSIPKRLECEARNAIRPPIAKQISTWLTQITKGVRLRPISSLYYLDAPFIAPGLKVSAMLRRVELVGDRVRFHAFILPESES